MGKTHDVPHSPKIISVTGGKGGVGKSFFSANLAIALGQKNRDVLLLDADLGMANLDIILGLDVKSNLSHVLAGDCDLLDIVKPYNKRVNVIPAASGNAHMANLNKMEHMGILVAFEQLYQQTDVMIIDTAAGISDSVVRFSSTAHEIFVIVCNEPTSITDSYAVIKHLSQIEKRNDFHIICNMVNDEHEGINLFKKLQRVTDSFLDINLIYETSIYYDEFVKRSIKRRKPLLDAYPKARASKKLIDLSDQIDRRPAHAGIFKGTDYILDNVFGIND